MFEDIDFNITPMIAAVSTVLVIFTLMLMGGTQFLQSRKRN